VFCLECVFLFYFIVYHRIWVLSLCDFLFFFIVWCSMSLALGSSVCSWLIVKLGSRFICYVMKTHSCSGTWLVRRVLLLLGVVQSYIGGLADSRAATITSELLRKCGYPCCHSIPVAGGVLLSPLDGMACFVVEWRTVVFRRPGGLCTEVVLPNYCIGMTYGVPVVGVLPLVLVLGSRCSCSLRVRLPSTDWLPKHVA